MKSLSEREMSSLPSEEGNPHNLAGNYSYSDISVTDDVFSSTLTDDVFPSTFKGMERVRVSFCWEYRDGYVPPVQPSHVTPWGCQFHSSFEAFVATEDLATITVFAIQGGVHRLCAV